MSAVRKFRPFAAALILGLILLSPRTAVNAGRNAMALWYGSVAPALFPFLALMPALTGAEACAAYGGMFGGIMKRCFRLPGQAAPAVIIAMIAGSPGGAVALRRIAGQCGMDRGDAARIALAMGGVSPAYLVLGVGQGLFGSAGLGFRLALAQILVQFMMLALLGHIYRPEHVRLDPLPEQAQANPVRTAVETVLIVCGYMVLFSSATAAAAVWLGPVVGRLLLLAADLPSGLAALAQWNPSGCGFLLGGALGFGGLCIAAQNLDALADLKLSVGEYLGARLCAAALFAPVAGFMLDDRLSAAYLPAGKNAFAFSLLAMLLMMIPVLNYFSNSYFLNKKHSRRKLA